MFTSFTFFKCPADTYNFHSYSLLRWLLQWHYRIDRHHHHHFAPEQVSIKLWKLLSIFPNWYWAFLWLFWTLHVSISIRGKIVVVGYKSFGNNQMCKERYRERGRTRIIEVQTREQFSGEKLQHQFLMVDISPEWENPPNVDIGHVHKPHALEYFVKFFNLIVNQ